MRDDERGDTQDLEGRGGEGCVDAEIQVQGQGSSVDNDDGEEDDAALHLDELVFDEDGELDEEAAEAYREVLIECFIASKEAEELAEHGIVPGAWAEMFLRYAMDYPGVTAATMSAEDVREVVFDLFPRKVSCDAEQAPDIVLELRAFFAFLGRALGLVNIAGCQKVLAGDAETRLRRALSNPANFGMAKGFFMTGRAMGFDVTTEEGMAQWMAAYNASPQSHGLAPGLGASLAAPTPSGSPARNRPDRGAKRKKRRMQKASRRKNR